MTALEGHINGRAMKKGREQEYTSKGKDGTAATSNQMNSAYDWNASARQDLYLGWFLYVDKVYLGTFCSLNPSPGQHSKKRPHYIQFMLNNAIWIPHGHICNIEALFKVVMEPSQEFQQQTALTRKPHGVMQYCGVFIL